MRADDIARICLEKFKSLPKNGKPEKGKQWTVLAAFVQETKYKDQVHYLNVVSLATGTTCIGSSQMDPSGKILHDCHAEILARRGFTRYLLGEILKIKSGDNQSIFVHSEEHKCLQLKDEIFFHFYTSQTPCGDASIFPIKKQKYEKDSSFIRKRSSNTDDDSPNFKCRKLNSVAEDMCSNISKSSEIDLNRTGAKSVPGESADKRGEGLDYHEVGVLRIKPGRGIPTHSMSCSDKILKWNLVGCQGSLISILLQQPIYLKSIVVGKCSADLGALQRALINRVDFKPVASALRTSIFVQNRPEVLLSDLEFEFSRPTTSDSLLKPCGSSIVWCNVHSCPYEVVAKNGYRLGAVKKDQGLPQSVCNISRYSIFVQFQEVLQKLKNLSLSVETELSPSMEYSQLKSLSKQYQSTWKSIRNKLLKNWLQHDRSLDNFILDKCPF